jgi:serine protease Do
MSRVLRRNRVSPSGDRGNRSLGRHADLVEHRALLAIDQRQFHGRKDPPQRRRGWLFSSTAGHPPVNVSGFHWYAPALPMKTLIAPALAFLLTTPLPASALGEGGVTDDLRRSVVVRTVEHAAPAVVAVYTEKEVAETSPFRSYRDAPYADPYFAPFSGGPRPRRNAPRQTHRERVSMGSGVIVDATGVVVTNQHVIVGGDTIRVQLSDHREFEAKLVGGDSDFDLAVLRIQDSGRLPYIPIGNDDSILIGETVIAIGNPYGLDHTVTTGVVSARGRSLQTGNQVYQDIVQTDASINPGNSGGPLLDIRGRLLGINTAIHRDAQGIGFAIPIWRVRNVVDQILAHGSVLPTWIGLEVQDLTGELASHFGVKAGSGVLVRGIEPDSPAARADVHTGDIVTRVQGERIENTAEYDRRVRGLASGERLRLALAGEGGDRIVELDIAALPTDVIDRFAWQGVGLEVAATSGVVVVKRVRPGSPAAEIGFASGDVLAAIGGREIEGVEGFRKEIGAARSSSSMLVSVVRGRRLHRVVIPLGEKKQRPAPRGR